MTPGCMPVNRLIYNKGIVISVKFTLYYFCLIDTEYLVLWKYNGPFNLYANTHGHIDYGIPIHLTKSTDYRTSTGKYHEFSRCCHKRGY